MTNCHCAERGSQRWLQELINCHQALLNKKIAEKINQNSLQIQWLSPLDEDNFREYGDKSLLVRLGIEEHAEKLKEFWPEPGPQWDGCGKTSDGKFFLIEAKANIHELISSCRATDERSRKKIDKALAETQQFLRCNPKINWVAGLYQFANRIAHLYFFREKCGLDLWLVHIYFCNDQTHIKTSKEEFEGAVLLVKMLLGLEEHRLDKYILNLFVYTDRTFPTFG